MIPPSVLNLVERKSGLILITGAVGTGKSTTMSVLIDYINKNDKKHIITIEDPIEFMFTNDKSLIEQREV
jgi:twitching motility protein PilT